MPAWFACLALGPAVRGAQIVLDDDTKLVQLDHWRLRWRAAAANAVATTAGEGRRGTSGVVRRVKFGPTGRLG